MLNMNVHHNHFEMFVCTRNTIGLASCLVRKEDYVFQWVIHIAAPLH